MITKQTMEAINTAFRANFAEGQKLYAPTWSRIATLIKSTTSQNTYPSLGDMPGMREWIGDRQQKEFEDFDYTIKNRLFEQTVKVKRTKIEDDEYGLYAPLMTGLGQASAMWPDQLVYEAVRKGFTSLCSDGQFFFDIDHPVYNNEGQVSGTVSNMQAGAGAPWMLLNTKGAMKPFLFQERVKAGKLVIKNQDEDEGVFMRDEYVYGDRARGAAGYCFWQMAYASKDVLNEVNFKAARASMRNIKNTRGEPVVNEPDLLVVGVGNADLAEDLLKKLHKTGGETNTLSGAVEFLVTPYVY
jgi:phage major head subunit gpT-like protein